MIKKEELVTMPEYWMETIQNEIYFALKEYMKENKLNQTELAEKLGFSKGYISQVLHGNFNHSMQKLIELSLAIGKAPDLNFTSFQEYLNKIDREHSVPIILSVVKDDPAVVSFNNGIKANYKPINESASFSIGKLSA